MRTLLQKRIVDLSQLVETNGPVFPTTTKPYIGYFRTHEGSRRPNGVSSQNCIMVIPDHVGTHVDATLHFDPAGKSADKIPLELMMGNGVVLDFSGKKPKDAITLEDVRKYCKEKGIELKERDIVLFETGASKYYGRPEYLDYIVEIKRDLIKWLVSIGIRVIGVDAITIDTDMMNIPSHMLMREEEFFIIENLTNLDQIKAPSFEFVGLPLKLAGATGSPIRAIGLVQ